MNLANLIYIFFRYQFVQQSPQTIRPPVQQIIPQQIIQQAPTNYPVYQLPVHYHQNVVPVPVPTPAHYPVTTRILPTQTPFTYTRQEEKPSELNQIAEIAQMAAQKFYPTYLSHKTADSPAPQEEADVSSIRSFPPIITGFENFSPEQQAKIKEQLSAHFGAPLQPLSLGKDITNQLQNFNQAAPKFEASKQEIKASSSEAQPMYAKV